MDLLKERDILLRKLLQNNNIIRCGEYGGQQESRLKEYRNSLLYHKFVDPYPGDVEKEWESLERRVENAGQYEKKGVLGRLSRAMLSNADAGDGNGTMWQWHDVDGEGNERHHGQIDYWHRVLLLLLRLSRSIEGTYVDVENIKTILKACGQRKKRAEHDSQQHMLKWLLETGYEEDEDDAWWRENLVYSSGDELSEWSNNGDAMSDAGLASLEERERDVGTKVVEKEIEEASIMPEETTYDAIQKKICRDADAYMRNRIRPVKRRLRNQSMLSSLVSPGRDVAGGLKYDPTSLSVWLASKYCKSHLSDALNPRYCVEESDFLKQAINCLRGMKDPGFAFCYDKNEGYRMKDGVHTINVSVGALKTQAEMVLVCANSMHRLNQYTDKVRCVVKRIRVGNISKTSNSMLEAFAAAVDRQIQIERNSLEMISSLLAMHESILPRLESFCKVLLKVCRQNALQEITIEESAKTVIDTIQIILEECQLQCSSGEKVSVLGWLAELFYSTLFPFVMAMDTWISFGSLENAPLEFCIKEVSTEDSQRSGSRFVLHPCPALFDSCIQEFFTVGVSFSVFNRHIENSTDLFKLQKTFVNILGTFNGGLRNCLCQATEGDEHKEAFIHTDSSCPSAIFRRDMESFWFDEWMQDASEHQHAIHPLSGLVLNDFLPLSEHNRAQQNSFVPLIQGDMDVRMYEKSKLLYNKSKLKTKDAWYWTSAGQSDCSDENDARFSAKLKRSILNKIEAIGHTSQQDASSTLPIHQHGQDFEPISALRLAFENTASLCSKGVGMKTLTRNLVDQTQGLKFLASMNSPIWHDFVCKFVEYCSSTSGLDAMAVSNLNSLISEAMDVDVGKGCTLRNAVSSAWLEHEEHSVHIFHSRDISYIKNCKWKLEMNQPLKAMLDQEACDVVGDLRDLFLQLLWVWATLSAAKRKSRHQASKISKASHASLFLSTTILRSIIQSTREYIDAIFDTCAAEVQTCQRLGEMRTALDRAIKSFSEGDLSYNTPFRDNLRKWLDSVQRCGILILRADQQNGKSCDMVSSDRESLPFSPSKESFVEGLDAATHDVRISTSKLLGALEKESHAFTSVFSLRFQDVLTSMTFN